MPDTDINPDSFELTPDDPDGPEGDAPDSSYDPTDIEVSRGRQLGLGVGERDLKRQLDVHTGDDVDDDGGVEELKPGDPRWE